MPDINTVKNLVLEEISLVDRPANTQARVSLYKRANPVEKGMVYEERDKFRDALADQAKAEHDMEVMGKTYPMFDALRESMKGAMMADDAEKRDRLMRENVEEFLAAVKGAMGEYSPDTAAGSPGTTTSMMKETTMDIEELTKRLGEAEESIARLTKERDEALEKATNPEDVAKAEEETVEIGGEKIAKSAVPEPVLKALEEQRAALEAMTKRQEREDLAKRAEAELPNLGGTADQKGALLKALDGMDKADAEALMKGLKAADAAVSKMFVEVGKSAADDASSATSRLNKMASDYAAEKGVDQASAFAEVTKSAEGKRLWAESRSEQ